MLCALGVLTSLALSACSAEPVPLATPPLSAGSEQACRDFLDALPETLAGQDRREVEPADALGAAYGDPPIAVTCTDQAPPDFDRFASCDQVNDIGWFIPRALVADPEADAVLSAMSHRPIVQLDVPVDYRPDGAAAALAELSDPIESQLTLADECL